MNISLLADCPDEAPVVAQWYFQEWAYHDPEASLENVTQKVALGINRDQIPIAFVISGGELL